MKTKNLSVFIMLAALLLLTNRIYAQSSWKEYKEFTSTLKPVTNYAVWSDTSKSKLYDNCIVALHISGFELDPQKAQSGKANNLIVTNSLNLDIPFKGGTGAFALSIIVYNTVSNTISINIQVNRATVFSPKPNKQAEAWLNNKISEEVDKFISQLGTIEGKPNSTTTAMITIESGGK